MARFTKKMQALICKRVKRIRVERFGEGHGAQKKMAEALGIPYTTYRGYEANRANLEFLRSFSRKFDVPLMWLMFATEELARKKREPQITIFPDHDRIVAPLFTVIVIKDGTMEPTIRKGSWVGIKTKPFSKDLNGKIVGIKKDDQFFVRRLLFKGKTIIAIGDNPLAKSTLFVSKMNVLGEAAWCWQKF